MLGGTFEYLISSLPHLSFQNTVEAKERTLSILHKYNASGASNEQVVEILNDEAAKFLSGRALTLFETMDLKNIHEEAFQESNINALTAYSRFSFKLKEDLRELRMAKKSGEVASPSNKMETIIGKGSPLQKEINLIKYQWAKVEEVSSGHFANIEALITYKIKLMLLLRWWSFNESIGLQNFKELTRSQ
jgi:uncharacterized protein YqfB (UPF0267 family)